MGKLLSSSEKKDSQYPYAMFTQKLYDTCMKIGAYEIQVPFVTTAADTVKDLLELIDGKTITHAVDLGSGDGRVILELGKNNIHATGYEIKPELINRTKTRIENLNLPNVEVFEKDFWEIDFSAYDLIYIYGMSTIMGRLEEKLEQETKPGTLVITNVFTLPHWKIKKQKNYLHLYITP